MRGGGQGSWDSTGATTLESVIMSSAKPPVKHMAMAPTPRPRHSAYAFRASALRNQCADRKERSDGAHGGARPLLSAGWRLMALSYTTG